ncbi:MAG TPA: hypothetical protein VFM55_15210 [Micromonosporaceae bacterium]|nr:hypothetical protein [Micromonosporaceae bacterium]
MTSTGQTWEPYQHQAAHAAHTQPAGPDPAVAIDVRNQAVGRMRWMNVKHAQHAWDQRYSDPLAPYGLAFLFVQPTPGRAERLSVKAATKLWLAGLEAQHLPRLLFGLNEHVGKRMQTGPLDLRTDLANRVDDSMADSAYYIGVGLSSLDTHTGVWEQAREQVENVADVPGRVLIVLTDQTTIVCERRGLNEYNAFQIHSTHSLGDVFAHGVYRWGWSQPEQLRTDPAHAEVLHWLDTLNLTLWQADNARLVATRAAARSQRRGDRGR